MRIAVISDVHGNLHALEAALAAIDAEGVDAIWCLGDLVGYGPRPNECCTVVAARAAICLVGNHDLGVLGDVALDEFSHDAAVSARWTQSVLDEPSRTYLASLAPAAETDTATLAHGSPRDPVWEYVLGWDQAAQAFALAARPIVLVGHTHVPLAFTEADEAIDGRVAPDGTTVDLTAFGHVLLNPGSVGQPRDGDARAAWLLLDLEGREAVFRRTDYPVARTQAEIGEAGLPEGLALRLEEGL
jgi:predicted phosphodiesterase